MTDRIETPDKVDIVERLRSWLPPAGVRLDSEDYVLINHDAPSHISLLREALEKADHALSHLECYKLGDGNLLLIKQVRERNRAALSATAGKP